MDIEKKVENNELCNIDTQQLQDRPSFDFKNTDTAFCICGVLFCVFVSVFGIFGGYALGYLISCVLMMGLFVVYFASRGKVRLLPLFCGFLSIANSAVFICTSNGSVRFFSAVLCFLMGLVCFDGMVNGKSKGNTKTIGIFYTAIVTSRNIGKTMKALFAGGNGNKKAVGKALIGLAGAIPVLLVVIPLLISSDAAFGGMMENIFKNTTGNIFKAVLGVNASVFVLSYGVSLKKGDIAKIGKSNFSGIENAYIISFLSAVSFCYVLYLFSQLAYFFSAFKGFLPDGEITFAQYARKGFFEMCAIAVINLNIVFLALLFSKKKNGKACNGIKILSTFIAIFTLIIISTAISKMVLYIDAFGMTVLRITTSAFMVFLAIVFISVVLRIYFTKINIVKTGLIAASFILIVLGSINVNGVCAKYNYESYKSQKLDSVDLKAMYDLGDEGIPYLVRLSEDKNKAVAEEARYYLADAVCYEYFEDLDKMTFFSISSIKGKEKHKGFERFSIPRYNAYETLYAFIEENPEFASECMEIINENEYIW